MLDLKNEEALTLNEVRRLPFLKGRRGNAVSLCTLNRWRTRGIRGVVLESARSGGTVVTSAEAVLRFMERLSNGTTAGHTNVPADRQRRIAAADRRLDNAGL